MVLEQFPQAAELEYPAGTPSCSKCQEQVSYGATRRTLSAQEIFLAVVSIIGYEYDVRDPNLL